ncbi:MAG: winged helix-turn-helix domain-containing protein [Burkholderiaceae bacterium]|nr:winged helix-turn-helix domain-containing protein [Burkholderiaceae bacterium]
MTVPTYDKFSEPMLRFLALHPSGTLAREANEAAANALNISNVDRQELLSSGVQLIYKNRAGWAHDRLKREGLSSSPRRGFWQITEEGSAYVTAHPEPLSLKDVEQLAIGFMNVRLRSTTADEPLTSSTTVQISAPESLD